IQRSNTAELSADSGERFGNWQQVLCLNGKHNRKQRMGIIPVHSRKGAFDNPGHNRSTSSSHRLQQPTDSLHNLHQRLSTRYRSPGIGLERTFGPNGETDMAHRTQSIFETAHEAFTKFGSVIIQIHGFDASHHPTEPLVVLSDGDGGINGALQAIASHLEAANLSVGIFDGFTHEKLGAQKNVQGRYARAFGAGFVHSEISSIVVYDDTLITKYENSLTRSILNKF